jgi:methionyl-tRNA formyltransferase
VLAQAQGIEVYQPESLRTEAALQPIFAWQPDLIVTVAFGQLLPPALLEFPPHRCINVHASLLPKYRGGAPIQHALINGEPETGVTIMYMERGLDTGAMLARQAVPIGLDDDNGTMHEKLSRVGAQLLLQSIPPLLAGQLVAQPQVEADATFARNIRREDERLDWRESTVNLYNRVRGLHPWPIAYTLFDGEVFKIWRARPDVLHSERERQAVPGTILRYEKDALAVRTGDGVLALTHVQPAGRSMLPVSDYVRGKALQVGAVFDALEV